MKKVSCLILFLSIASSFLAVDPSNQPIYESFLKCFSNQTSTAPDKLCDVVLPQSSASFTPALCAYIRNARYNTYTSPKPLIVIAARSEAHVQATVLCTKSLNFQLKTRSGSHDYDGLSCISNRPYFVLNMSYLRNITVDMADDGGSAWVGAGATLGEVYYNIWQKSKSYGFPAGVCPTVGVRGRISGGGYGNMIRKDHERKDHGRERTRFSIYYSSPKISYNSSLTNLEKYYWFGTLVYFLNRFKNKADKWS